MQDLNLKQSQGITPAWAGKSIDPLLPYADS